MEKYLTIIYTWLGLIVATTLSFGQVVPTQIPIAAEAIPQFVDPVPHFAGHRVDASGGNLIIKYVPGEQIAVSTGTVLMDGTAGVTPNVGFTPIWAYRISNDNGATWTRAFWPAYTIEAQRGTPLQVTYYNELYGETYESVNLIADQTLHWANPYPYGKMGSTNPYYGPIPTVPHLHGGEVASESDGGPDAWFTPGAAETGPSWGMDGTDDEYFYPNTQEAATLWYHDHSLGVTRLNVYAGLAGFYFLRGPDEENSHLPGWSGDDLVKEITPAGKTGIAPEYAPTYLPEIELVIQDRMFDTNGELYFPSAGVNHPFWVPEFLGDVITVNGKTWPYLSVAPRKYRFRLLNGSNARFYELFLRDPVTDLPGPSIVQVGTDGGLMNQPAVIPDKLLLAPGERADVIIDFSMSPINQMWTVRNTARAPYPKGETPKGTTAGRIMQFVVNGEMVDATTPTLAGTDKSSLPASLRSEPIVQLTDFAGTTNVTPDVFRQLTLNEVMYMGQPFEALLNNSKWDMDMDNPASLGETELPVEGTTEMWQIINLTGDAHPIHIHLVQFQIVGRQKYNVNKYTKLYNASFTGGVFDPESGPPLDYNMLNADGAVGGNPAISPYLQGAVMPALQNEQGWKDTYVVYPGEVATFITRFAPTDIPTTAPANELLFGFDPSEGPGYVWHCHILDHEDNEMMRPYKVVASPERFAAPAPQSFGLKSSMLGETTLDQNSPNPFSTDTEITFTLAEEMYVQLLLFDETGNQIEILIDGVAPKGYNIVRLNASQLTAGIYIYQLRAGSFIDSKKMIVVK